VKKTALHRSHNKDPINMILATGGNCSQWVVAVRNLFGFHHRVRIVAETSKAMAEVRNRVRVGSIIMSNRIAAIATPASANLVLNTEGSGRFIYCFQL
jgi:hypothetical protein